MIIEGHLYNDNKRLNKEFKKIHEDLDKYKGTDKFYNNITHCLEYVLDKYESNEWSVDATRSALYHLMDDFGELPLLKNWFDNKHWLGKYVEDKKNESRIN